MAGLVIFELLLVLVYGFDALIGSPSKNFEWFVNLDEEGNLPAWFSAAQFLLIGLVFFLKSRQVSKQVPSGKFFMLIGLGFLFLSADEASMIHELVDWVLRMILRAEITYWAPFYALVFLVFCLLFFRSIQAMWTYYRYESCVMAVGMGIIILGSVGLEALSFACLRSGATPGLYLIEVACEEFCEMFGASVILYGSLLMLRDAEESACGDALSGC